MDIKELQKKYDNKEISVYEYIKEIFHRIEKNNYNSYITLNTENALKKAKELDEKLEKGLEKGKLFGVPIAVKDNILIKGLKTTAASKSLSNFIPIYDADIIEKLHNTDAILIGKTNMDEFAMGSSSETSYYGASINPFRPELTAGGSSTGSATAVAGEEAILGIGTDTGGSVRNPADFCHIVGFAPSYGAISRHGTISMSNSFDRVGILANSVHDVKELFDIIRGMSKNDFTSHNIEEFNQDLDLKDIKIATIELKDEYKVNPIIKKLFDETIQNLKDKGANISTVSFDHLEYINQAYTVLMSVEVESNIAKIDGLRYGESVEEYSDINDFYVKNRTQNFGEEVKRRIALGNMFASKDNEQKYYKQSMKIRNIVRNQVKNVLKEYDIILTPTTIDLPKEVGKTIEDSNASFDSGIFNTMTNLSNIPAISIPMKKDELGSVQLVGDTNKDMKLLKIAELIEGLLK